jgi:predicted Zn-dependent protease
VNEVLPADAFVLHDYAVNYLTTQSLQPLRLEAMRRAGELLQEAGSDDRKSLLVLSEIQIELGDRAGAIETLRLAADLNRDAQHIRIMLVELLAEDGQYDEALDELMRVRRLGRDHQGLELLQQKIERMRIEHADSR